MDSNLFKRRGNTAQNDGRRFEKFWASLIPGAKVTPGSGNKWFAKLDVRDSVILWTLKYTLKRSYRLTPELLGEALDVIHGQGGIGGDVIPGAAIQIDDETFVVFYASDFFRMAESGNLNYIVPSKGEQKRSRAKTPSILR